MERAIQFRLNGKPGRVDSDGERKLISVLRSDLGLSGTKCGCEDGFDGVCTVLVGDETVWSCLVPLK